MQRLRMSLGQRIRTSKPAVAGRSAAWPALMGTALGIIGSLSVTWLNSHLTEERERQMRFRNERLELYVSVLDAAEGQVIKFRKHAASLIGTMIESPSLLPVVDRQFSNLIRQMELISSDECIGAVYNFEIACTMVHSNIVDKRKRWISRENAVQVIEGCSGAFRSLVVSLRRDLGTSAEGEKLSDRPLSTI